MKGREWKVPAMNEYVRKVTEMKGSEWK